MPSNSALTCLPPTAARRTDTRFSAIILIHLFVQFAHHNGLDCREKFGGGCGAGSNGCSHGQRRAHIPTNHPSARGNAQLATNAGDKVPNLPSLIALWLVQGLRAVFAGSDAGVAISVAPAEDPFGKGAETFFS